MKAIDLFAGAGGFSLAANNCGVQILAAIELDKTAAQTYKKNIIEHNSHKTQLINEDINRVNMKQLKASLALKTGELDLLLGGPPCQGFSSHRINNAGVDDPRNALLFRYFDFINTFKPKAFLVENVSGLLWKRHAGYLNTFISLAQASGYDIKFCGKLNAKNYGVPQNRQRVFILGARKSIKITPEFTFPPKATHFAPGKALPHWRSASCVFEKPPEMVKQQYKGHYQKKMTTEQAEALLANLEFGAAIDLSDKCNVHMQHTAEVTNRFAQTPLNGSRCDITFRLKCHANNYAGHKDVYGRIILDKPSNTITTGCNNPSKGRFVHPWLNHGITLRHAARLQTFPDTFEFIGTITNQAKQIGNAVPIKLGEALIKEIKRLIQPKSQVK
ncbi:DNA cytosine methyltransferase [Agarivorans sp. QJM3NY_33]|uniref:DNA cytosine methyltransferase n=1 Tax=Agarivorans sp. QJM3NY_33 TaxID=3421432 RepID=UPI003D7DCF5A